MKSIRFDNPQKIEKLPLIKENEPVLKHIP